MQFRSSFPEFHFVCVLEGRAGKTYNFREKVNEGHNSQTFIHNLVTRIRDLSHFHFGLCLVGPLCIMHKSCVFRKKARFSARKFDPSESVEAKTANFAFQHLPSFLCQDRIFLAALQFFARVSFSLPVISEQVIVQPIRHWDIRSFEGREIRRQQIVLLPECPLHSPTILVVVVVK